MNDHIGISNTLKIEDSIRISDNLKFSQIPNLSNYDHTLKVNYKDKQDEINSGDLIMDSGKKCAYSAQIMVKKSFVFPREIARKEPSILLKKKRTCLSCCKFFFKCQCCIKNKRKSFIGLLEKFKFLNQNEFVNTVDIIVNLFLEYNERQNKLFMFKNIYCKALNTTPDYLFYYIPQLCSLWCSILEQKQREFEMMFLSICENDMCFSQYFILNLCRTLKFDEKSSSQLNLRYMINTVNLEVINKIQNNCLGNFKFDQFVGPTFMLKISDVNEAIKKNFKPYMPMYKSGFAVDIQSEYFNFEEGGGNARVRKQIFELVSKKKIEDRLYLSNQFFFSDLIEISKACNKSWDKVQKISFIQVWLKKMNQDLPSFVYLPTENQKQQKLMVMKIEPNEVRIFETKSKINYMITLQLVSPEEYIMRKSYSFASNREKNIKKNLEIISKINSKNYCFNDLDVKSMSKNVIHPVKIEKSNCREDFEYHADSISVSLDNNQRMAMKANKARRTTNKNNTKVTPNDNKATKHDDLLEKLIDHKPLLPDSNFSNNNEKNLLSPIKFADNLSDKQYSNNSDQNFNSNLNQTFHQHADHSTLNCNLKDDLILRKHKSVSLGSYKIERNTEREINHEDTYRITNNKVSIDMFTEETKFKSVFHENTNVNIKQIIECESEKQLKRIRATTMYSIYYTWTLKNYIVKVGEDVRQEQFAMQLIKEFDFIFKKAKLPLKLTTYEIIPIGPDACQIEMIQDAITIDNLKKILFEKYNRSISLFEFFDLHFQQNLKTIRINFLNSLVAYSLLCYFLQIKDRHNGNIMINTEGSMIHIDFGYLFTQAPGKGIKLEEKVPFKLIGEYIAVLGDQVGLFVRLFHKGFRAIIDNKERLQSLVRIESLSLYPIECLNDFEKAIEEFTERLTPPTNKKQRRMFIDNLIQDALDNWKSRWYDIFQKCCEGIDY